MIEYGKNSKRTTAEEIQKLKESIELLGDISGIVYDVSTDEIICGNQRSSIIDINNRDITYVKEFKKPDKFGTLAYGHVEWEGQLYTFRKVKWNEEQRQLANLSANLMYSSYDFFELGRNFTEEVMKESGFDTHELKMAFGDDNFVRDSKMNFDGVHEGDVRVVFGDEEIRVDRERYDAWMEREMFEADYREREIENKIRKIIQDGISSYR